jgi:hypothetical protein
MFECEYCARGVKHPLYVYLLSDKRCINNPSHHKVVPYIGVASNPFVKLRAHNRLGKQCGHGNQLTKAGAGHYQLELVFGPLWQGGGEFKKVCRRQSRKIKSRILRFCDYAKQMQQSGACTASLYARDQSMVRALYMERAAAVLSSRSNTH